MKKIFVAGHKGMVGSAICRQLENQNVDLVTASREELDLTEGNQVREYFRVHKFDQVYLAAAKVGGINANNSYPAEFIYQNLMIQNNIIHQAHESDVNQLLFLGSSCIYPKLAPQPIVEADLLTGALESTNEPYAIAKIAGLKLCESYNRQYGRDYRSVMPTNLYGPMDNFHPQNSHVLPALLRRFHEAKNAGLEEVTVWGSGSPMREFLHVDDMANACIFVMDLEKDLYLSKTQKMMSHINIGFGKDFTIKNLAEIISGIVGFSGKIIWDTSMPDGTPRKLMNTDLINSLGWFPNIELKDGIQNTYEWFLENYDYIRS